MRINQLRDYLDALLASGVDPNTPVCIHDAEGPSRTALEVIDAAMLKGEFLEDPSPKMCGFRSVDGTFLLLQTCIDYDQMLNGPTPNYVVIGNQVDVPAKSWPNGHWFTEPRRQPGQL